MSGKWCTIESDPGKPLEFPCRLSIFQPFLDQQRIIGVFTELIKRIGVKGIQVDELITLEDEELAQIKYEYP
jgi:hypothetical protein